MPTARLNITHDRPDSVLISTLDQIDDTHEARVAATQSANAIGQLINNRSASLQGQAVTIDLIAHSSGGVLQLGDWEVQSGAQTNQVAHAVRNAGLTVAAVRLLGCVTAATEAGQQAILDLAAAFRTSIYGTTVPIGAGYFGIDGFEKDTVLVNDSEVAQLHLPPIAPTIDQWHLLTNLRRKRWLNDFPGPIAPPTSFLHAVANIRAETTARADRDLALASRPWPVKTVSATNFGRLFDFCEPQVAPDPALLAVPDFEVRTLVPSLDGARVKRAIFLLDGGLVRFFPKDHPNGLIARVRPEFDDRIRLIAFGSLDAAPHRLWPPP